MDELLAKLTALRTAPDGFRDMLVDDCERILREHPEFSVKYVRSPLDKHFDDPIDKLENVFNIFEK